ncbi:MAG: DUF4331 domain-containing protein [Bacteroidia bacterium]|nr:DUF4331 domain-containing protein [Bacteroidia bacterium]NND24699.1 DUF4331 family protein [Flavobacteriaceae bacterium]MBT8278797.1 DUF4331 domain-containing protein [Bacteroidia bacterium]NNK59041.1 DUF4331 family protein [Flavobacteriaceae bacterium]NNL33763.1 DUF4331 family protein [Flavobacteriaceae bacterium]
MKTIKLILGIVLIGTVLFSCSKEENLDEDFRNANVAGTYLQMDQMARPAINTVFVSSGSKDAFNTTIPSEQNAAFQAMFQANLQGLSPAFANDTDANALGLTAEAFSGFLSTDVLNVSTVGTTTFFDGVNVLTGRALADDVITVELLLIFGGEDFSENPGLSDDHVDANDVAFLPEFPYLAAPH